MHKMKTIVTDVPLCQSVSPSVTRLYFANLCMQYAGEFDAPFARLLWPLVRRVIERHPLSSLYLLNFHPSFPGLIISPWTRAEQPCAKML